MREAAWQAQRSAGSIQEAMKATSEHAVKAAAIRAFENFANKSREVRIENTMRYVTGPGEIDACAGSHAPTKCSYDEPKTLPLMLSSMVLSN